MEKTLSNFIFSKLRYEKFLTLEVMLYVEQQEIYNFMFTVSKETRSYLLLNFITVKNAFINEGLITHLLRDCFYSIKNFEKIYLEALKRKHGNRKLTIYLWLFDSSGYHTLIEIVKWI